ncbi:SAM-dependent methyltransferase [Shinella sp. BE166]|uniref:class I SAM-dependent methyltransferase n=1 Tax=Shinella sp. BE166 TaxID=3373918 RepID=UPI003EBA926F
MAAEWASGYVTDLGYTYGFYRELTPAILQFAALTQGFESCLKPSGTINYCELGCGQGFSANLIAAANPEIGVYATDFNPEQISGAQRLADVAGITNVHFFDNSFADFNARSDLPQFDIIALHGIYSWIAKEHRDTIIRFIDARLKPGGLVYVSYNCLPGWSGAAPMRQLMRMQAAEGSGTISAKIDSSFALIERLESSGARYFKAIPDAKKRYERLKSLSKNYLAHEYLNKDWTLFYHSDVSSEMAQARLSYVASANLMDHVDQINLTSDQQSILRETADISKREVLRDYIINQQFRRDVFSRGAIPLSIGETRERWLNSYFALTTPGDSVSMKTKGALGEVTLQESTYRPIIEAFAKASGAISLREVLKNKTIADLGWNRLQQAIIILVGTGHVQPCLAEAANENRRRKSAKAFNNAVIERSQYSAELNYLASPVTGGAVSANRFEQLFLLSFNKKEEDAALFVWNILKRQNQHIVKNGDALKTDDESIAEIRNKYEIFKNREPILKNIGVL